MIVEKKVAKLHNNLINLVSLSANATVTIVGVTTNLSRREVLKKSTINVKPDSSNRVIQKNRISKDDCPNVSLQMILGTVVLTISNETNKELLGGFKLLISSMRSKEFATESEASKSK